MFYSAVIGEAKRLASRLRFLLRVPPSFRTHSVTLNVSRGSRRRADHADARVPLRTWLLVVPVAMSNCVRMSVFLLLVNSFIISTSLASTSAAVNAGISNPPPTLNAISNQSLAAGSSLDVAIQAVDPDGDAISFSTNSLPDFVTLIDNGDGTGLLSLTPGTNDVGVYSVTVMASDNGTPSQSASTTFTITVFLASTILADAGNLYDRLGILAPSNSVAVLVVDTGTNGFVDPQSNFPLSLGATWGSDDKIIGLWDLTAVAADFGDGQLFDQTVVAYTNGIATGQRLQLYWFPSLTLASNTLGVTYYGKYTDTNNPALDGGDVWQIPAGGMNAHLEFWTTFWGGSNPETTGFATNLTAPPLAAFQNWQIQYFGDTNNAAAAVDADPDGDGQSNEAEFLSGTDPTNSASAFRITAVLRESNDLRVIWTMGSGRTNALQVTTGDGGGSYTTNNYSDIFTVTNTLGSLTNYLDVGGATNVPSRFYRIRLVQ